MGRIVHVVELVWKCLFITLWVLRYDFQIQSCLSVRNIRQMWLSGMVLESPVDNIEWTAWLRVW